MKGKIFMAKKSNTNFLKSLNAHKRLFKKANYGPNTLESNTSYCYHAYCIADMEKKKRKLTNNEKKSLYKDAKSRAYDMTYGK